MIEFCTWTHDDAPEGVTLAPGVVVRWVHDEMHETRGSYAYDTDAETAEAENAELAALESGQWVALGCIVDDSVTGENIDSLWGIVIAPDSAELAAFFGHSIGNPSAADVADARISHAETMAARARELADAAHAARVETMREALAEATLCADIDADAADRAACELRELAGDSPDAGCLADADANDAEAEALRKRAARYRAAMG